MELKNVDRNFRKLPIELFYFDDDGKEQTDVLNIKYWPITQRWLDEQEQVKKKIRQTSEEGLELARLTDEIEAKLNKAQAELLEKPDDEELKRTAEELKKSVDESSEKLEKFVEDAKEMGKRMMAEHLAPILIDLDIVDEGKPVKPTVEFLMTRDFELLNHIATEIKKRAFQARLSG